MITALAFVGCTGSDDTKDVAQTDRSYYASDQRPSAHLAGFDQAMAMADSLYNCMQFRDAYKLYLGLLDSKECSK